MAREWHLIPALAKLRDEFNMLSPGRDRASDGTIGDTAHQASSSDHNADEVGNVPIHDADDSNEVHAIDIDSDLKHPTVTMEKVVQFLIGRCRSSEEDRLRYMIYNRRIWRASNEWKQEAYTGPSPHTEHAHFSGQYVTALEADVSSWHLADLLPKPKPPAPPKEESDMPTADEIAKAVWDYDVDGVAGVQRAGAYLTTENARSREMRTVIEPEQAESLAALHTVVNNNNDVVLAQIAAVNQRLDSLVERLPAPPEPTA